MTKSKTSTIAIVVLSVLLAAALAATIVLAAFTASRTATTTIQFAGGISIEVTGISPTGESDAYAWNATYNGQPDVDGEIVNATADVTLDAISIKNTSTDPIWIIAKTDLTSQTVNPGTGWVAFGSNGWYIYGASSTAATNVASQQDVPFVSQTTVSYAESTTVTATVDVYAVSAYSTTAMSDLNTKAGISA